MSRSCRKADKREGRQEGRQEGKQEGRQQGILETVIETLEIRLGSVPRDLVEQLNSLSAEQLRLLHREALTCADLDSFRQSINWDE